MDFTQLTTYNFKISVTVLFSDSTYNDISQYVSKLRVSANFLNHIFPLFLIQFNIPPEFILKIQDDENVKFKIGMIKAANDDENNLTSEYFKSVLYTYIKMDRSPLNITDNITSEDSASYQYDRFEMILFPEDALALNKPIVSGAYRNCTVLDSIIALTNKLNTSLDIYQPDNRQVYNQIILKPTNVLQNIRHINNIYGLYTSGFNFFYTLDKLNIFPMDIRRYKNINNTNHIYVRFTTDEADSSKLNRGMYYDENGKRIINCRVDDVIHHDSNKLVKELMGNKLFNFYSNEKELINLRTSTLYDENEKVKTKVYRNKYNNLLKENEFKQNIINTDMIEMSFTNMDFNLNDLNRLFIFNFDNDNYTKYNGNYQLCYILLSFDYDTQGYSGIKGSLYLKKINNTSLI